MYSRSFLPVLCFFVANSPTPVERALNTGLGSPRRGRYPSPLCICPLPVVPTFSLPFASPPFHWCHEDKLLLCFALDFFHCFEIFLDWRQKTLQPLLVKHHILPDVMRLNLVEVDVFLDLLLYVSPEWAWYSFMCVHHWRILTLSSLDMKCRPNKWLIRLIPQQSLPCLQFVAVCFPRCSVIPEMFSYRCSRERL